MTKLVSGAVHGQSCSRMSYCHNKLKIDNIVLYCNYFNSYIINIVNWEYGYNTGSLQIWCTVVNHVNRMLKHIVMVFAPWCRGMFYLTHIMFYTCYIHYICSYIGFNTQIYTDQHFVYSRFISSYSYINLKRHFYL